MTYVTAPRHDPENEFAVSVATAALVAEGYSSSVADALAQNGHGTESTKQLSTKEIFECWLTWEGIIGYADTILAALDNIREVGCEDAPLTTLPARTRHLPTSN